MESPNGMVSRTDPGKRDEGDESEEMNSSASEDEEYESDSGREESTENESESDSEIARDFSIHQKVCPSVAKCAVYEEKLVEEKRRLRLRLKDMRAGCKELTEKRRALSIIKQTIHVESKIRNLERILGWMYEARGKMSTPEKLTVEVEHAPKSGIETTEESESVVAAVSLVDEG